MAIALLYCGTRCKLANLRRPTPYLSPSLATLAYRSRRLLSTGPAGATGAGAAALGLGASRAAWLTASFAEAVVTPRFGRRVARPLKPSGPLDPPLPTSGRQRRCLGGGGPGLPPPPLLVLDNTAANFSAPERRRLVECMEGLGMTVYPRAVFRVAEGHHGPWAVTAPAGEGGWLRPLPQEGYYPESDPGESCLSWLRGLGFRPPEELYPLQPLSRWSSAVERALRRDDPDSAYPPGLAQAVGWTAARVALLDPQLFGGGTAPSGPSGEAATPASESSRSTAEGLLERLGEQAYAEVLLQGGSRSRALVVAKQVRQMAQELATVLRLLLQPQLQRYPIAALGRYLDPPDYHRWEGPRRERQVLERLRHSRPTLGPALQEAAVGTAALGLLVALWPGADRHRRANRIEWYWLELEAALTARLGCRSFSEDLYPELLRKAKEKPSWPHPALVEAQLDSAQWLSFALAALAAAPGSPVLDFGAEDLPTPAVVERAQEAATAPEVYPGPEVMDPLTWLMLNGAPRRDPKK